MRFIRFLISLFRANLNPQPEPKKVDTFRDIFHDYPGGVEQWLYDTEHFFDEGSKS